MIRRAAAAVSAVVILLAGAAAAQTPDRPGDRLDARLHVESLTGVLTPGGELRIRVRVRNGGDDTLHGLRLLGTLHRREISRFGFQGAVDDGRLGTLWESFASDVEAVRGRGARVVELSRTAAELGFGQGADRHGVYPMRIQLQHLGEVVDEIRTSVVVAPEQVEEPVRAALLLPLDEPPARQADYTYSDGDLLRAITSGGRLSSALGNAAGAQPAPLTVATSGLLLEQVADIANGYSTRRGAEVVEHSADSPGARQAARFLERLQALLAQPDVEHVAMPYGPADLVALVRHGMNGEAVRLISEGQAAAERLGAARPLPGVLWPPDGLDQATLAEVLGAGVQTVVLGESYLDADLPTFSPSPLRRLRSTAGAPVRALVPDPWLADVLGRDLAERGRAIAAQRVIAETAAVYFERPNAPDRGLLIAPTLLWDPPPGLVRDLLDGFAAAPWLEPVTLSELVKSVDLEGTPVELAYPRAARSRELGPGYLNALANARRALGSLAGVLALADDTPGRFDRLLLASPSVHYRGQRSGDGRELIDLVADTVGDLYDAVRVVEGPVVTLAGTEGRLPVTLVNDATIAVRVQVRFVGPRYEFDPPVMRDVVLPPGESKTVAVDATALSPGGIAGIRVLVEDADGVLELAEGTVVVRSTGLNLVALAVTAAAGLFLLAWWVRGARRRRAESDAETSSPAAA